MRNGRFTLPFLLLRKIWILFCLLAVQSEVRASWWMGENLKRFWYWSPFLLPWKTNFLHFFATVFSSRKCSSFLLWSRNSNWRSWGLNKRNLSRFCCSSVAAASIEKLWMKSKQKVAYFFHLRTKLERCYYLLQRLAYCRGAAAVARALGLQSARATAVILSTIYYKERILGFLQCLKHLNDERSSIFSRSKQVFL